MHNRGMFRSFAEELNAHYRTEWNPWIFIFFKMTEWLSFPPYEVYKRELSKAHGSKYSFWGKYDKQ